MSDECKNSIEVLTFDMTDPATRDRMLRIATFVLAMLVNACDSPAEAYTACHLVQEMLGEHYNIAGCEDCVMPTNKIQ